MGPGVFGDVPSLRNPLSGCRFHTRCPLAVAQYKVKVPPLVKEKQGHWAACWFVD